MLRWVPGVLIAVGHIAGDSSLGYMTHNAHAPVDLDHLLAHLLHRAVAAHIKQVGLQVLAVGPGLSSNQKQGTSRKRSLSLATDPRLFHET